MKDIVSRKDLELLLRAFYNKALTNPEIGPFFTEVAQIELEEHLPHITDFWEQQLFRKGNYKKNVLQIHKELHDKRALKNIHFDTWISLFKTTVDENFDGDKAQLIKTRALSIITIMKLKINDSPTN